MVLEDCSEYSMPSVTNLYTLEEAGGPPSAAAVPPRTEVHMKHRLTKKMSAYSMIA